MKKILCILGVSMALSFAAQADSPLTSTEFYKAYSSEQVVTKALNANGRLNTELISHLMDHRQPLDLRLAAVNALGWDFNGKSNASLLWSGYLADHYKSASAFMKKGSADELIIYAYLLAMDNYNEVEEALAFADAAKEKDKKSFAVAIVHGLIEAQSLFDTDWCKVYYTAHKVKADKKLKMDFRSEASGIIFDYMSLYEDSCDK